jgi:hypothetical protein
LFTSISWQNNQLSKSVEGKKFARRILDDGFWDGMEIVHNIFKPLYEILRLVDTEILPTMPILFAMFHTMKQQISRMKGKKWVLDIINNRWDKTLYQPLHAAGMNFFLYEEDQFYLTI